MAIDTKSAIEGFEHQRLENERLKSDIEQMKKVMVELRQEAKDAAAREQKLEPYLDLIEMDDKDRYILNIKNPMLYKQLKIRARQVYGPDGDVGYKFMGFLEKILTDAIYVGWPVTMARQFAKNENT